MAVKAYLIFNGRLCSYRNTDSVLKTESVYHLQTVEAFSRSFGAQKDGFAEFFNIR
jgi:hypothetical protein